MKKLSTKEYKMFESIWDERVPPNSEMWVGKDKKPLNSDSVNLKKLMDDVFEWGEKSRQGFCCGILGCKEDVSVKCKVCKGGYCDEHKKWHSHTNDAKGVILKEVQDDK